MGWRMSRSILIQSFHNGTYSCIDCKKQTMQGFFVAKHPAKGPVDLLSEKDYIEERAIEIANYIIEERTTVRQAAKKFGVSKSTIHKEVTKWNGLCGW